MKPQVKIAFFVVLITALACDHVPQAAAPVLESAPVTNFQPAEIAITKADGQILRWDLGSVVMFNGAAFPNVGSIEFTDPAMPGLRANAVEENGGYFSFGMSAGEAQALYNDSANGIQMYAADANAAATLSQTYGYVQPLPGKDGDLQKIVAVIASMTIAASAAQLYYGKEVEIAAAEEEYTDIEWGNLTQNIEDNVFFTKTATGNHADTLAVLSALETYCPNKLCQKKGDGQSSGSIRIYVGTQGTTATALIALVLGKHVGQIMITGDISTAVHVCTPGNCVDLGGGSYFNSTQARKITGWLMSDQIGNGKMPDGKLLDVSAGWERLNIMIVKYNLREIAEIRLP